MSEICLSCYNAECSEHLTIIDVLLVDDLCESCGQIRPCIVRYRRPLEKWMYRVFHRRQIENELIRGLMDDYARAEGEQLQAENERLLNDPDAGVPADIEMRMVKFINDQFGSDTRVD